MENTVEMNQPVRWMENTIKGFVNNSSENTLGDNLKEKAWEEPLVGFSSGADPLYAMFKEQIGPFYWTPLDIFKETFEDAKVSAEKLSVISWILPQTGPTRADNRKEAAYPSERWARARLYGEEANVKLRAHVVETLMRSGIRAVAPMLSPQWRWRRSERYGLSSNWSERHAAYAAGLGTFGLCDGLITPKGKAMRCGSVVAEIEIPPTERPYSFHNAYCLFYSKGLCKECMERCPAAAISERGHDKTRCLNYLREVTASYVRDHYRLEIYGCGLCQTGVPCESRIPTSC